MTKGDAIEDIIGGVVFSLMGTGGLTLGAYLCIRYPEQAGGIIMGANIPSTLMIVHGTRRYWRGIVAYRNVKSNDDNPFRSIPVGEHPLANFPDENPYRLGL